MSWIQNLHETYEHCANAPQFASNPLLPIGHTTQQAHIEIVIDMKGNFERARVVPKTEQTTLVPCTESSGGRSGKKPGGFKFQVQRVNVGAVAHRLPAASQSRDIFSGVCSGDEQ